MHAAKPTIASTRPNTPSTTLKARNPTRPVSTAATNRDADLRRGLVTIVTRSAESPPIDRKSTRLNSSHGYISYAVFCLKKKNSGSTMPQIVRQLNHYEH